MNEHVVYAIERGLRYEDGQVVGERGRPLKPILQSSGYCQYTLVKIGGGQVSVYAHKVVYYLATGDERAFDYAYDVHHIDGDKSNNHFENLQLMDKHEHRRMEAMGKRKNTKLTPAQVADIRIRYAQGGATHRSLAREYGISHVQIGDIIRLISWVLTDV